MKKAILSLLAVIMAAQVMAGDQGNIKCVMNIMGKMNQIAANPVKVLTEFSACAGDQTWDYMAPFLGGFLRPVLVTVNPLNAGATAGSTTDSDYATGFTTLNLYNMVMNMVKQAVGELLGFIESDNFGYVDSKA